MVKVRTMIVAVLVALPGVLFSAAPALADGCNDAPVPQLYKKLTGKEMFHCPW